VAVLGSGSSGNSTLVESSRGRLLIDCGFSARETARRLERVGCDAKSIDAVLVTHEHTDHAGGAATFSRRFGVPICATRRTAEAAGIAADRVAGLIPVESGEPFELAGMRVRPFSVPHDAADNIGLVAEADDGTRLGYATDLGHLPRLVVERLRGCEILVAEANHDEAMLQEGPYPWHVKQRILSRHGHLSNAEAENLIAEIVTERTLHIFLAHMSTTNNTARMALDAGRRALDRVGRRGVGLVVARQREVSEVFET